MAFMIGESTGAFAGAYSTWGKLRTPLIGGYDQYTTDANVQPQPHNFEIESGFHATEGLLLRCSNWPQSFSWIDINSNPHTEYTGPIVGFQNGGGSIYPSYFSIGAYDASINDTTNPVYTSINNLLDQGDIDDSLAGLTVTYSSGTFAINSDALENNPPYAPWFGQDIGLNAITSVTAIDTFTAF